MTGSGPVAWNHDATPWGIADLCGNVWEWVAGMRQDQGEVQVIADNDSAVNTTNHGAGSRAWKAILLSDGSLVAPGTAGTAKYDSPTVQINDVITTPASCGGTFQGLATRAGLTIPARMKQLLLAPIASSGLGGDYYYVNNQIEGLPIRGGGWNGGAIAGVFGLDLLYARSDADSGFGFRPAYVS